MAIHLEMTYGKKLGLPEYSSHHFSVSLKSEVANLDDLPDEVERVYHKLQASVDKQIANPGFMPGERQPAVATVHNEHGWRCSEKQQALIVKLVDEHQLDRTAVDQLAIERFGHGIRELNKLEASGLIDALLAQTGSGTRRGRSPRRAA